MPTSGAQENPPVLRMLHLTRYGGGFLFESRNDAWLSANRVRGLLTSPGLEKPVLWGPWGSSRRPALRAACGRRVPGLFKFIPKSLRTLTGNGGKNTGEMGAYNTRQEEEAGKRITIWPQVGTEPLRMTIPTGRYTGRQEGSAWCSVDAASPQGPCLCLARVLLRPSAPSPPPGLPAPPRASAGHPHRPGHPVPPASTRCSSVSLLQTLERGAGCIKGCRRRQQTEEPCL